MIQDMPHSKTAGTLVKALETEQRYRWMQAKTSLATYLMCVFLWHQFTVEALRRNSHPTTRRTRPTEATRLALRVARIDRKSTRLNSSHSQISYAVFCLKKKNKP